VAGGRKARRSSRWAMEATSDVGACMEADSQKRLYGLRLPPGMKPPGCNAWTLRRRDHPAGGRHPAQVNGRLLKDPITRRAGLRPRPSSGWRRSRPKGPGGQEAERHGGPPKQRRPGRALREFVLPSGLATRRPPVVRFTVGSPTDKILYISEIQARLSGMTLGSFRFDALEEILP
jgi:hypothetical protein